MGTSFWAQLCKTESFFPRSSKSIIVVTWTYSYYFQWDVWYTTWPEPQHGSTQHDGSIDCRASLFQGITGSLMLFVLTPSLPHSCCGSTVGLIMLSVSVLDSTWFFSHSEAILHLQGENKTKQGILMWLNGLKLRESSWPVIKVTLQAFLIL